MLPMFSRSSHGQSSRTGTVGATGVSEVVLLSDVMPEGGMPKDVRLEVFVAGEKKVEHH